MIIYAADDEELALELLREAIVDAIPSACPVCFRDPEALLSAAKERKPDVVFLDIEMEGMNGIEVAGQLNEISSAVKIIFVTGYSEYAGQAFDVYASGYLMKPCRGKNIKPILEKIGLSEQKPKAIQIRTFGNFEIYYNGKPIFFRSRKGKELLAYLVDREGAAISRQEIAGILYGDNFSRSVQTNLSKMVKSISEDLQEAGIGDFFSSHNGYAVTLQNAEVDFLEYLKGSPDHPFLGEYMEQYSWGEYRKNAFAQRKRHQ